MEEILDIKNVYVVYATPVFDTTLPHNNKIFLSKEAAEKHAKENYIEWQGHNYFKVGTLEEYLSEYADYKYNEGYSAGSESYNDD